MPAQYLLFPRKTKPRTSSDCSWSDSRLQGSRLPESLPRWTGRLLRGTTLVASVVAFGAMRVHAGYSSSGSDKPFWAVKTNDLQDMTRLLAVVLSVQAGWMILALLVSAAVCGERVGWSLAGDALAETREKALGWCIIAASVHGCVTSAVMIAKVTWDQDAERDGDK